jgi:serine/threonine protein kinase
VGRGAECDVTVPLPRISKAHARVVRDVRADGAAEKWSVIDEGSKNGCTVAGKRVTRTAPTEMTNGDVVQLGPYEFRFFNGRGFAELVASCSSTHDAKPREDGDAATLVQQEAHESTEAGGARAPAAAVVPPGYEVVAKLGAGGMAEVVLAKRTGPGGFIKRVALKRILPEFAADPARVEMFIQEARIAARVNHPNVVQIFELGESNGQWFIAMEYIDGWDLSAIIRAATHAGLPIPLSVVLRLAVDMCAGLHAAHVCVDDDGQILSIVHRDVSPHNVLVSRTCVAKVADFGVSKASDSIPRTKTGELKGKVVYMAPEQVDPKVGTIDRRTDIYAAGLTLYEMLTGKKPLRRETEMAMLDAVIKAAVPDIRTLRPDLPAGLVAILDKALKRDPAARFQTAAEMQAALEALAGQENLVSTPARCLEYLAKLPRLDRPPLEPKHETDTSGPTAVAPGLPRPPNTGGSR